MHCIQSFTCYILQYNSRMWNLKTWEVGLSLCHHASFKAFLASAAAYPTYYIRWPLLFTSEVIRRDFGKLIAPHCMQFTLSSTDGATGVSMWNALSWAQTERTTPKTVNIDSINVALANIFYIIKCNTQIQLVETVIIWYVAQSLLHWPYPRVTTENTALWKIMSRISNLHINNSARCALVKSATSVIL